MRRGDLTDKQWALLGPSYEKRAENYQAMLTIAAIMLWL